MSDALADLDPALYVQPPVLDVPGGIALGTALLHAMDPTLPAAVQQAAVQVETEVLVLERRWDEQQQAEGRPEIDARTADLRLDRAWVAVGRRLEVLLDLPGHLPQAEQAAVLYRRLFPDELAFLNLPFRQQWAQSEQRLRMIEHEGLEPQLEPLVGGFVLDELRDAHEEYGRVLGIDDPNAALATPARLAEGLRALRDSIGAYALQLVAVAHADPERADSVRASLRPISNVRWGLDPFEGMAPLEAAMPAEGDARDETDATNETDETGEALAAEDDAAPGEALAAEGEVTPDEATPDEAAAPEPAAQQAKPSPEDSDTFDVDSLFDEAALERDPAPATARTKDDPPKGEG